ncbi:septal ring lytic transglycosylase RlpA family protein [Thiomonas intermedia]|uniref:septal ring lytic transglycosylase RlpA family protein n=1 Tax=Thiomonas intermedia TaxID=926 RepID=UPI001FEA0B4E|nr:septal ring lytic transglycosylase RlpA family protein [Thiomonas intermedia]
MSGAPVNAQAGCHAPTPNLRAAYNRTYTVRGRSYTPLRNADGYDEVGTASWYGWESGTTTSMGTRFNPRDFSAASRVLPLPTCVQVTNLDNGLSALVLVNDRGPFVSGRLLDLSMGAAQALGVTRTGTARVRIVALPEGANAPLQYAQAPAAASPPQDHPVMTPSQADMSSRASTAAAPQQFATQPVTPSIPAASSSMGVPESPQDAPPAPIEEQVLPPMASSSAPAASVSRAAAPPGPASSQETMPQPALSLLGASSPAGATPASAPPPAGAAPPAQQNYVQTGAFTLQANAEAEQARLQAAGIADVIVVPGYIRGQTFYRVQVGPLPAAMPDATLVQQLRGLGLNGYSVVQQ